MERALITYGWNRVAYIVNRTLAEHGIETHVGDVSGITMNRWSRWTHRHFTYPSFFDNPEAFLNRIITYATEHEIPYFFPTHEETLIASKYQNTLKQAGIKTLLPSFESIKTAHLKDKTMALAQQLGVPTPTSIVPFTETEALSFFEAFPKPIVLKYHQSNSSKGVFFLKDRQDLHQHIPNLGQFSLQEYVQGDGFGVCLLYNQDAQLRASFTHKRLQEKLVSGGTSTLRISTQHAELEAHAKRLLSALNWVGPAMVEFKVNPLTNQLWLMEINPRLWGSLALPYHCGLHFPWLMYSILKHGDVAPQTDYTKNIRVKWVLGSVLATLSYGLAKKRFSPTFLTASAEGYDDVWSDDVGCFLGEIANYGARFLKARQLNPTAQTQFDITKL